MTLRAFRYRFYPTPEQDSLLRRTVGCVRLVYNKALEARSRAWKERQEKVGYRETSKMLTQWKQEEELQFLGEPALYAHGRRTDHDQKNDTGAIKNQPK